ncbi:MAG: hypothetical protein LKE54_04560 [Prevotella sp.]|jgi:hypothetical protein|nr:hypothetical protein [Prevotella sp.]MCH3994315.1 hypothetical protein [Prevotella sp.]
MKQTIGRKRKLVNPRDFYRELSRKDKGKFLLYLAKRYDYPTTTMSGKLRNNPTGELRKDEFENVSQAIEEGLWDL